MPETMRPAKPARRRTIPVLAGVLALLSAASLAAPQFADAAGSSPSGLAMPGDQPGWKVTFADDFSGASVDEARWGRYSGVPHSGQSALWQQDHALVRDGALVLHADQVGSQWVTAGVSQARAGAQQYGRFDVRFRIPRANQIGYAILLYPEGGSWPPEIDLAEDGGGARLRTMTTSHWAPGNQQQHAYANADFSQWHTVSVVWTAARLTYLLDGVAYGTATGAAVPQVPMWLGLQTQWWKCVAEYGNCPAATSPSTVDMEVDWVVRYAADAGTLPGAASSPSSTTTVPTTSTTTVPTTTTTTSTTARPRTTTAPAVLPPATTSVLLLSRSANRSGGSALNGAKLDGRAYIRALPSAPPREVRFYLDDPQLAGPPRSVEHETPFDLAGGTPAAAQALELSTLAAGPHTVIAVTVGQDGRQTRTSAVFTRTAGTAVKARSGLTSRPLQGQILSGAVFVGAVAAGRVREVRFYLDDPKTARRPVRVDTRAPYDLVEGTSWNPAKLAKGQHTLTVATVSSIGKVTVVQVNFTTR